MYSKALAHSPKESSVHLISLIYDWRVSMIQQSVRLYEEADLPMQCVPAGYLSSFLIALLIALFHLQSAALGKEDKWPRVCPDPSPPPNVAGNRSPWILEHDFGSVPSTPANEKQLQ